MKTVYAVVYGKEYTLACDEGQEPHLKQLVTEVDARTQRLEKAVGKLPEAMMLLYTALMTADELHDVHRENARLREELATAQRHMAENASTASLSALEEDVAENLSGLAEQIDALTFKLAS